MHYLQEINAIIQRARPRGFRILPNGTQLVGRVPHVAPNAWLHELYPPLSDSQIDRIQQDIQVRIPEDFKDFLALANGLGLFSGSINIYGQRDNYGRNEDDVWQPFDIVLPNTAERPRDAKDSFLFVGGYPEGHGFYIYIDVQDGKVYRCSRRSACPLNKWQGFPQMMRSEAYRIAKLFDERGRMFDPTQPVTPPVDSDL